MTTTRKKVSITMPHDLHSRAVTASGDNLSDFVSKAVEEKLLADAMAEYHRLRLSDPADDVYDALEADAA
ncbi:hypothetical protein ACGFYQ_33720 [Streptomyces sp. NPDC048258]|uniref:hypothetical protein n=1 Tax=Streptomyces sp. NPDC048258 TaxID=3365527 RepID=UPI003716BE46